MSKEQPKGSWSGGYSPAVVQVLVEQDPEQHYEAV